MKTENPYRTNAASPLELKIIELGDRIEKLNGPHYETFSIEVAHVLREFGYKQLHHCDIPIEQSLMLCIRYYSMGTRLAVLTSDRCDPGITHGHAYNLEIYYGDMTDDMVKITLSKITNRVMPGLCAKEDWELYYKIRKEFQKIDDFKSFMAMF